MPKRYVEERIWRLGKRSSMDNQKENTQLAENLRHHVYQLAHEIGDRSMFRYDQLVEAGKYITEQLGSFGYPVEFQDYKVSNKPVQNIIVSKSGIERPQEVIIVGAHYDTCFNPGADDNASAVAGLLELARLVKDQRLQRSIKFTAFVNEEPPFFQTDQMGSRIYARAAKKGKENIQAVVILEMIGYYLDKPHSQHYPPFFGPFYPNKGNFIAIVGNFPSRWLVKKIILDFNDQTSFPVESITTFGFIPGVSFSDHWSFWKEGYPAVMITDTAFYRNPNYHSSSDTPETLNYEKMVDLVMGLNSVLIGLANSEKGLPNG